MRSIAWYVKWPGNFYALGPVRFERRVTEREVRADQREWAKLERLPVGFQCWPTND